MIRALFLAAAVGTVSPLVVPPPDPLSDPVVVQGRELVRRNCVGCHSVQPDGISIFSKAPPFRWMKGIRPDLLKTAALQAGRGDHAGMPAFILTDSEATAISAYIHAYANAEPKTQKAMSLTPCLVRTC